MPPAPHVCRAALSRLQMIVGQCRRWQTIKHYAADMLHCAHEITTIRAFTDMRGGFNALLFVKRASREREELDVRRVMLGRHDIFAQRPRPGLFLARDVPLTQLAQSTAIKRVQVSKRPVTTNPHDYVEIGFLIRAFEGLGLLDVPPRNGSARRSCDRRFRKIVRCRGGGKHGNLYTAVDCALLSVVARPAERPRGALLHF
jgi:hypothetical protein